MPKETRSQAAEYLNELKRDLTAAHRLPSSDDIARYARFLHRGEQLLYVRGDRAVVIEVSIPGAFADLKAVRRWDDGSPVSDADRGEMFDYLDPFFRAQAGKPLRQ